MGNGVTKQNGAALVVGLIMLLVMTLMGVTSMNATRTELKIAINLSNHSSAFQTAAQMFERALVDSTVDWADASSDTQSGTYASTNTLSDGTFAMTFSGCRMAEGSSLTGAGGKMIVHQVATVGNFKNSAGDIVGVSKQTSGYKTIAAGCSTP